MLGAETQLVTGGWVRWDRARRGRLGRERGTASEEGGLIVGVCVRGRREGGRMNGSHDV
jgi:hypothetical protein